MKTYGVGAKAYIDSFRGMVPCVALKVEGESVTVRVTKPLPAYPHMYTKGEIVTMSGKYIVPCSHLVLRGIYYRINTQFKWI